MNGVEQVLTDLARAQGELRRSSTAFDEVIEQMHGVLNSIAKANQGQTAAMAAVAAATDAALRLVQSKGNQ